MPSRLPDDVHQLGQPARVIAAIRSAGLARYRATPLTRRDEQHAGNRPEPAAAP